VVIVSTLTKTKRTTARAKSKAAVSSQELKAMVTEGVKAVYSGEKWKEFLRVCGSFYKYSLTNTILIHSQRIFVPMGVKIAEEDRKPDGPEKKLVFKVGSVFDVSQTEGKDFNPLGYEYGELDGEYAAKLFSALIAVCPLPVRFGDTGSNAKGWCSSTEICIAPGLDDVEILRVLVHEMAHAFLHWPDDGKPAFDLQTRELQAESVAYAVCSHFGIPTLDSHFLYLASYAGRDFDALEANVEAVHALVKRIVGGC
jgi:hypothetical protein